MPKLARRLKKGDLVRVVCPSFNLDKADKDNIEDIRKGISSLGLRVDFSKHAFTKEATNDQKLDDLHSAFSDPNVKAIFAGTGGFSSNRLLTGLDYGLIKSRPKIFCGYSDITILLNAIYAKTGLITYHGPNAGGTGGVNGFDYTQNYLEKAFFSHQTYQIEASETWFDKDYTKPHPKETKHQGSGFWKLNPKGIVEGRAIGGNLTSLVYLAAGGFLPKLKGSVLFIEDDYETMAHHFDEKLEALTQSSGFNKIEGLVIGRFQPKSEINREILTQIITSKPILNEVPILGNVDFGHTKPQATFPIGGIVQLKVLKDITEIKIIEH